MRFISVCKNVIASNNKRGWVDPDPAIRVGSSKSGKAIQRAHTLGITDAEGNIVARIVSSQDGHPVLKCGAKVAIITEHETLILE
jgi:hypothetical protein